MDGRRLLKKSNLGECSVSPLWPPVSAAPVRPRVRVSPATDLRENSHQFAGSLVLFVRIAPTPHHGAGRTRHDHGGAGPPIAPLLSSPLLSSPLISTTPHRRPTPPTQGFAEEGCWPAAFGGLRAAASLPVGQAATERARALVDSLCRESAAPDVPPRCAFTSRRSSSLAAKTTTGLEGVRVSSSRRRRHGARAHAREAPSHGRHGAVPCVYVAAGTAGPLGRLSFTKPVHS